MVTARPLAAAWAICIIRESRGEPEAASRERLETVARIHADASQLRGGKVGGVPRLRKVADQDRAAARAGRVETGRVNQVGIEHQDVARGSFELNGTGLVAGVKGRVARRRPMGPGHDAGRPVLRTIVIEVRDGIHSVAGPIRRHVPMQLLIPSAGQRLAAFYLGQEESLTDQFPHGGQNHRQAADGLDPGVEIEKGVSPVRAPRHGPLIRRPDAGIERCAQIIEPFGRYGPPEECVPVSVEFFPVDHDRLETVESMAPEATLGPQPVSADSEGHPKIPSYGERAGVAMRSVECVLFAVLATALPAAAQVPIEGRVLTDDGAPVAGVSIDAFARENAGDTARRLAEGRVRLPLASVKSGPDGAFRFAPRLAAAWLQATAEGYAPEAVEIAEETPITLTLKRAAMKRGLVTAAGQPVEGAQVIWVSHGGAERHTRTGADGAFEAHDPAVVGAQLTVLHKGHSPLRDFVAGGLQANPLDQKLDAGVALRGSAVDAATEKAVANAEIWVDDTWPLARTDASGAFTIPHAPKDWTTVTARTRQAVGSTGRRSIPLVISLSPSRSLAGVIVDAATRRPLEGATVTVAGPNGNPRSGSTDSRGQYTIAGLPPGRYQAYVERPGYAPGPEAPRDIDLRTAQSDRLDLALTRLPRVEGRVVDEKRQPVDGALVTLGFNDTPHIYSTAWLGNSAGSVRTTKDGTFTLTLPSVEDSPRAPAMMKDRPLVVLKQGFAAAQVKVEPRTAKAAPIVVTLSRRYRVERKGHGPRGRAGCGRRSHGGRGRIGQRLPHAHSRRALESRRKRLDAFGRNRSLHRASPRSGASRGRTQNGIRAELDKTSRSPGRAPDGGGPGTGSDATRPHKPA